MKALLVAFVTAGALTVGMLPSIATAQQVQVGVGVNSENNGYGDGMGGGRWHHRHNHGHCHMVKIWRHHHRVWIKNCGM